MDTSPRVLTVQDLMLILRDSLAALTPSMDRAGIPWRDVEAYDDWDQICQVLFRNIIVRPVEYAFTAEGLAVAEYGIVYPSYFAMSFVEVLDVGADGHYAFVDFATCDAPLDSVRLQFISASDLSPVGETRVIPLREGRFAFLLQRGWRCERITKVE